MTVTSLDTDYDKLTITLIADFAAPIEKVWDLWSDPRKLERWWGPPNYPTTFEKHDLTPGGEATYSMTGPEGGMRGRWCVTVVDPPTHLKFTDAFAGPDEMLGAGMPAFTTEVRLTERDGGTRMEVRMTLDSREDMQKLVSAGIATGLRQAVGQMDALLA